MKYLRWLWMICALAPVGRAAETSEWQAASRKAHETEWVLRNPDGSTGASYLEIQNGLNRKDEFGAYIQADATIEVFEQGAIVRNAQYQAIFPGSSDSPEGTFDIQLPEGAGRFRGQCVGLAYTSSNGDSVFVAEMRNVQGVLVGPNEILYPDCFSGPIKADLRYKITLGGVVQDVILRSRPPSFRAYGLPDARLEVWTEIMNAPAVQKAVFASRTKGGKEVNDSILNFGTMRIGGGKAFRDFPGRELALGSMVRVHKDYEQIEGMTFLIEHVELEDIAEELDLLPAREQAQVDLRAIKERLQARSTATSTGKRKPVSLTAVDREKVSKASPIKKVARADITHEPGYVIDFDLGSSYTDFTFKSDTTYFCSGPLTLSGLNNVFEGGAVIKYAPTNTPYIFIDYNAGAVFRTSAYNPVIMCARDDHSAGVKLNNNSISGYYAYCALAFGVTASCPKIDFNHLRISDAYQGFSFVGSSGGQYNQIAHAQFVRVSQEVLANGTLLNLRNVLMDGGGATTDSASCNITAVSSTVNGEHLTINRSKKLFQNHGSVTLAITNSLFISVTNMGHSYTSVSCYTNADATGIFQEIGAGKFYLADGSSHRDAGLTTINATLATELGTRTTSPPLWLTNAISVDSVVWPHVAFDTGTPDLGFHYPRLDYLLDFASVTNATLTIKNGTVLGTCFGYGLQLLDGGRLVSGGTPTAMNRFVEYALVQEQPTRLERDANYSSYTLLPYQATNTFTSSAVLRFTEFIGWKDRRHYWQTNSFYLNSLSVRDCQFQRGSFGLASIPQTGVIAGLTNNLFARISTYAVSTNALSFYNNLFWQGDATIGNSVSNRITLRDCAFDNVALTNTTFVDNSYTAYINATNRLTPTNVNDVVISAFTYTNGPLGAFYHFSTDFSNRGSRTAPQAGLFHHTTKSHEAPELDTQVDIGFHYVSTACRMIDTLWVDDSLPLAGSPSVWPGLPNWSWISTNPLAFSGQLSYQSPAPTYDHSFYFTGASPTLSIATGDSLFAHVYLDTTNTPTEIMIQWNNGNWDHRAYWGANSINVGVNGTDSRRYMGSLPAAGQWARLEVPASQVGLEGSTLDGISFVTYAGRSTWDAGGKFRGTHCFDSDGDGLPDYLEDSDGDGLLDSGETNWQDATDLGLKVWITQPKANSIIP